MALKSISQKKQKKCRITQEQQLEKPATFPRDRPNLASLSGLPFEQILSYLTVKQAIPFGYTSSFFKNELKKSTNTIDLRDFKENEWCEKQGLGYLKTLTNVKTLVVDPMLEEDDQMSDEEDDYWNFSRKLINWAVKINSLVGDYASQLTEIRITHSGVTTWMPVLSEFDFPKLEHLQMIDDYTTPTDSKLQMIQRCFHGKLNRTLKSIDLREFHIKHLTQILNQLSNVMLPELSKITLICRNPSSNPISQCEINEFMTGLKLLAKKTSSHFSSKLTEVNLMNVDFSKCDPELFSETFQILIGGNQPMMKDLAVYDCSLLPPMVASLSSLMKSCYSFRQLQLHGLNIPCRKKASEETLKGLIHATPWKQFKELRLGNLFPRFPDLFSTFMTSLETSRMDRLLTLHLTFNKIGDVQAQSLAKVLPSFPSLQTLVLDHNRLRNASLSLLEEASLGCPKLYLISLISNQYDRDGVQSLMKSLGNRSQGSIRFILDKYHVEEVLHAEEMEAEYLEFDVIEPSMYMHECDHAIIWKKESMPGFVTKVYTALL
mmetsp:Transcript_37612/g.47416  ORF Transcript_37612/g.47416 Transcript_37612/m.47416 type:complete len:547 (-) Transcript_37612:205-1845(-)